MDFASDLAGYLLDEWKALEAFDLENFLDQYETHGYESKQEMINEGLKLLRLKLREEASEDFPDMEVDLSAFDPS